MLYEISFPDGRKTEHLRMDAELWVREIQALNKKYPAPFRLVSSAPDSNSKYCFHAHHGPIMYLTVPRQRPVNTKRTGIVCYPLYDMFGNVDKEKIVAGFKKYWDPPEGFVL